MVYRSLMLRAQFEIKRPFNYGQMAFNVGMLGFMLAAVKLLWSRFHAVLTHYYIWAIASLAFMITMNSGYMFNSIRGTPYSGVGKNGKLEIIADGFMNQFQIETQMVSVLCTSFCCLISGEWLTV
jgi:oligosaccharyltransferase complex subunit gamma